jgi:hypothetical protein
VEGAVVCWTGWSRFSATTASERSTSITLRHGPAARFNANHGFHSALDSDTMLRPVEDAGRSMAQGISSIKAYKIDRVAGVRAPEKA